MNRPRRRIIAVAYSRAAILRILRPFLSKISCNRKLVSSCITCWHGKHMHRLHENSYFMYKIYRIKYENTFVFIRKSNPAVYVLFKGSDLKRRNCTFRKFLSSNKISNKTGEKRKSRRNSSFLSGIASGLLNLQKTPSWSW